MADRDPDRDPDAGDADGNSDEGNDEGSGEDPRSIHTVVVDRDDVVTALEANRRGGGEGRTVLRVTPPFSGRMRARIHRTREGSPDSSSPDTVHLPPERLVADPPPFPHPDRIEDDLRDHPSVEYTRERHRRGQVAAVEAWRARVGNSIVDEVTIDLPDGSHTVEVRVLG